MKSQRMFIVLSVLSLLLISSFSQLSGADKQFEVKVEFTYGVGGSVRPKKLLAGESLDLAIQINNVELTLDGAMKYALQLDLLNGSKQLLQTRTSGDQNAPVSLGTNNARMTSSILLPKSLIAGTYFMRVGVNNLHNKKSAEHIVPFEIVANDNFDISNIFLSKDPKGIQPAGMSFNAGDGVFVHMVLHNATVSDGKWNIIMKLSVLDENNKVAGKATGNPSRDLFAPAGGSTPASIGAYLNRDGKYVLKVEIEDANAKNTVERLLPIVVVDGVDFSN